MRWYFFHNKKITYLSNINNGSVLGMSNFSYDLANQIGRRRIIKINKEIELKQQKLAFTNRGVLL